MIESAYLRIVAVILLVTAVVLIFIAIAAGSGSSFFPALVALAAICVVAFAGITRFRIRRGE